MIEDYMIKKEFQGKEISSLISELLQTNPCVDRKDLYVWKTDDFSLVLEINPVYVIASTLDKPLTEKLNYIWSLEEYNKNGEIIDRETHNLFDKHGVYDKEFITCHMDTIRLLSKISFDTKA